VLSLGLHFNQPLTCLPSSLTVLNLSNSDFFDRPLSDCPPSLRRLFLGRSISGPIRGLPASLTVLHFHRTNRKFWDAFDVDVPDSVTCLHLPQIKALPARLPSALRHLDFPLAKLPCFDLDGLRRLEHLQELSIMSFEDVDHATSLDVVRQMGLRVTSSCSNDGYASSYAMPMRCPFLQFAFDQEAILHSS